MKIRTSKGVEHDAHWAWAGEDGVLTLEYADARPMSQIAAEWEGCERILRESEEEGDKEYDGYTDIRSIVRQQSGAVTVALCKGG